LTELQNVLNRPKFAPALTAIESTADEIVAQYQNLAELVSPAQVSPDIIRDPKDHHVLACAIGGSADFIVTGDKDLLVLGSYQDTAIVTPSYFLQRLTNLR
jgi:putative PIN family toxin of toxin-antitoxin system